MAYTVKTNYTLKIPFFYNLGADAGKIISESTSLYLRQNIKKHNCTCNREPQKKAMYYLQRATLKGENK